MLAPSALIGNLSTLHSADRFASRGRTRSVSQKYMLAVLTPTSSATSATEQSTHGLRDVPQPTKKTRKAMPAIEPSAGSNTAKRGRPAKADQRKLEFVEWWKPGWCDRFR